MDDTPTIAAARRFLALLDEGPVPSGKELLRELDTLAMAYHATPEGDPIEHETRPPRKDYQKQCAQLRRRFPDYGYYAVADPTGPLDQERIPGGAIDDLADIAGDLEEALWRFETFGADDAHWHFRLLFEFHWGMHLRRLTHYLHATQLRDTVGD